MISTSVGRYLMENSSILCDLDKTGETEFPMHLLLLPSLVESSVLFDKSYFETNSKILFELLFV